MRDSKTRGGGGGGRRGGWGRRGGVLGGGGGGFGGGVGMAVELGAISDTRDVGVGQWRADRGVGG